ncbi:hypothetical protein [uncultured Pontibacter sp.]|uniref:hypothetical protein n=1 Tax=uncultured Pontibacter sp. TaxID=453356 RepID=UPI00261E1FD7|nr:hypothetical protein [uncultured Pontibacter sp.]
MKIPFNKNGVEIMYHAGSIHMSYYVSGSDDFELELTIKEEELPAFLERCKITSLADVEMSDLC